MRQENPLRKNTTARENGPKPVEQALRVVLTAVLEQARLEQKKPLPDGLNGYADEIAVDAAVQFDFDNKAPNSANVDQFFKILEASRAAA